ncbi:MAG: hypothetical protein ABRQ39_30425 [Candidatus Eremiobacterota bacterium]
MDISRVGQRMSAENFKKNNKVIFETGIKALLVDDNDTRIDVIDLNQNEEIDHGWTNSGFLNPILHPNNKTLVIQEPVLAESFNKIKDFAVANETEVITKNELENLQVADVSMSFDVYDMVLNKVFIKNERPLSDVAKEAAPFTPDAQWALDVKNDSFIVYEPKKKE